MGFYSFYMVYTCITMLVCTFFLFRNKKHFKDERIAVVFVILCLIILAMARPIEIPDTEYYEFLYENVKMVSLKGLHLFSRDIYMAQDYYINVEIGYSIFNYICRSLGIPFRGFLGITACMVYVTSLKGYNLIQRYLSDGSEQNPCGILTAFLLYNGLHSAGVAIRAGLSIGFGMLAMGFFLNKDKMWKVVICAVTAISMHNGAIIFIPILLLIRLKLTISKGAFLIIWASVLVFAGLNLAQYIYPLLGTCLAQTLETVGLDKFIGTSQNTVPFIPLRYWLKIAFAGLAAYTGYRREKKYANIALIIAISILMFGIIYPMRSSYRIIDYFYVFLIPYCFNERRGERIRLTADRLFSLLGLSGLAVVQIYMCLF